MSTSNDQNNESCTLVRDQVLAIGNAALTVHRTELTKSNFDAFTLIVEVSGNFSLANELSNDPDLISGQHLVCRYDGTEANAMLSLYTAQEFGLGGQKLILHFACSTIEAISEVSSHLYEFWVPHVKFGQGDHFTRHNYPDGGAIQTADHIKFIVDGAEWTIRTLVEIDGVYLPAPQARELQLESGAGRIHFNPSGHCALQVESSKLTREKAELTATNICWLLHLAFAQRVAWAELRVRNGSNCSFVCRRGFAFPNAPSRTPVLRNWLDGQIKTFLEAAYPVLLQQPKWWHVTLNWFSVAAENSALESSSMIYCMLFDRISSHLLDGFEFPKQISDQLTTCLQNDDRRTEMANRLGQLLSEYTANWTNERSKALVDKIEEWNKSPSYPKKIAEAFKTVGLTPPSGKLLKRRHTLMHDGGLKLKPEDALEFLFDLHQHITSLMLSMLGYRGKFFTLGRGEVQMDAMLLKVDEHLQQGGQS